MKGLGKWFGFREENSEKKNWMIIAFWAIFAIMALALLIAV